MDKTSVEKFGVARQGEIIGTLYDTEQQARQQLAHVTETMTSIGLKGDVDLVSVTVTTNYSTPRVIDTPALVEQPADAGQQPE